MTDPDAVDRQLALAWRAFTPEPELRQRVRARLSGAGQSLAPTGKRPDDAARVSGFRALRASGKLGISVGAGLFGLGVLVGLTAPSVIAPPDSPSVLEAAPSAPDGAEVAPSEPAVVLGGAQSGERSSSEPIAPEVRLHPEIAEAPTASAPRVEPVMAQPVPPDRGSKSHSTDRDWRGELTLLERAEKAVRTDNAALALALLGDFDARYPRSRLIEERQAIEVMAYCQARATDRVGRAEHFLRAYPGSVYAQRVTSACENVSEGDVAH